MVNNLCEFNRITYEFVEDIKKCFVSTTEILESNYNTSEMDTLVHLNYYIDNQLLLINKISSRDESIFKNDIFLLKDINFTDLWKDADTNIKNTIWKYCHTLYILAHDIDEFIDIINSHTENEQLKSIINNHTDILTNMIDYLKTNTENKTDSGENKTDSGENKTDSGMSFMNSMIGELAQELSGEINTEELNDISDPSQLLTSLMSGGDNSCLNKIVKSVGDKLNNKISCGEINEDQLFTEAQGMLKNFGNSPFNIFNNENSNSNGNAPDIMKMAQTMMQNMNMSSTSSDDILDGTSPNIMQMAQQMMNNNMSSGRKEKKDISVNNKKHKKRTKRIAKKSHMVTNDLD
jgi:hypothetical protein